MRDGVEGAIWCGGELCVCGCMLQCGLGGSIFVSENIIGVVFART